MNKKKNFINLFDLSINLKPNTLKTIAGRRTLPRITTLNSPLTHADARANRRFRKASKRHAAAAAIENNRCRW